jgi:tryptophan 2,3-dioxygenase
MEGTPTGKRELEETIETDFSRQMSYGDYLRLDRLLAAQVPRSDPRSTTSCSSSSSTRPPSCGSS